MKDTKLKFKSTIMKGQKDSNHHESESQQDQQIDSYEQSTLLQAQDLSWKSISDGKRQIEQKIKRLIPAYFQYQQLLYESAKQICIQSNMTRYDCQRLKPDNKSLMQKINKLQNEVNYTIQQKTGMIERVINERRIKKYYKKKHEINFQDQLDPQDDEKQIYNFYNQVFHIQSKNKPPQQVKINNAYNQQFKQDRLVYKPVLAQLNQDIHEINIRSPLPRPNSNRNIYLSPDNHSISFQQAKRSQKSLKEQKNDVNTKGNFHTINDMFNGFQPNLSFEAYNDNYDQNKSLMDINNVEEINEAQSQDTFGGKQKKRKGSFIKQQDDNLINTDNVFKSFIDKQNEELGRQKIRVQQLTQKALKVLNNENQEQQNAYQEREDESSKLKYLFSEIIEIYAVIQSLKFYLKFKSFQLLNKLYQNASEYYRETITFSDPIQRKHFQQVLYALMPSQSEQGIIIVMKNFFGDQESLVFDQFIEKFTPLINQKQFELFQEIDRHTATNRLLDLAIRLFNLIIQLDYFQQQTKKLLQNNQKLIDLFIDENSENALILVPQKIAQFITKIKKNMKMKKIKCQIYCRKILGQKMLVSQFYRWVGNKQKQYYYQHYQDDLNYNHLQ